MAWKILKRELSMASASVTVTIKFFLSYETGIIFVQNMLFTKLDKHNEAVYNAQKFFVVSCSIYIRVRQKKYMVFIFKPTKILKRHGY